MGLPEIWPGYETVEKIGSGSFGTVYKVRKKDSFGTFYSAVKKIRIPATEGEYASLKDDGYDEESITAVFESQLQDVVKEFGLMAQFQGTSHIVSYDDHMIIPHDGEPGWDILIRMELLTSLPEYLKQIQQNEKKVQEESIKMGIHICEALELIQSVHIIHRDIKPQNIMVNKYGDYKLSDFGVARPMDHMTKATVIGTPDYLAPEVFLQKPYDVQADQYSLGLVMYWMLNNRKLPFLPLDKPPTADQQQKAKNSRMTGQAFPDPVNGFVELNAIIRKACAYDPVDRFETISDLKKALSQLTIGTFGDLSSMKNVDFHEEALPDFDAGGNEFIIEDFSEDDETIGKFGSLTPSKNIQKEKNKKGSIQTGFENKKTETASKPESKPASKPKPKAVSKSTSKSVSNPTSKAASKPESKLRPETGETKITQNQMPGAEEARLEILRQYLPLLPTDQAKETAVCYVREPSTTTLHFFSEQNAWERLNKGFTRKQAEARKENALNKGLLAIYKEGSIKYDIVRTTNFPLYVIFTEEGILPAEAYNEFDGKLRIMLGVTEFIPWRYIESVSYEEHPPFLNPAGFIRLNYVKGFTAEYKHKPALTPGAALRIDVRRTRIDILLEMMRKLVSVSSNSDF